MDTMTANNNLKLSVASTQQIERYVGADQTPDLEERLLFIRHDLGRLEDVRQRLKSLAEPQLSQPGWREKLLHLTHNQRMMSAQHNREYLGYSYLDDDKWHNKHLKTLEEIKEITSPALAEADLRDLEDDLSQRALIYKDFLYRALKWSLWCKNTLTTMLGSIRMPLHQKLVKLHLEAVSEEASKIDIDYLTKPETRLLDPRVLNWIPTATIIEEHRRAAEKVFRQDIRRQVQFGLIFYALFALTIIAPFCLMLLNGIPADFLGNRFFGIPLVVMVWSLVGCLAALIRRFNRDPVYDWATFWRLLLGRPAQALVLSAVFWVVLAARLFSINGANLDDPFNPYVAILCFLLGFSDTFSNSIFGRIESQFTHLGDKPSDKPASETIAKPAEQSTTQIG